MKSVAIAFAKISAALLVSSLTFAQTAAPAAHAQPAPVVPHAPVPAPMVFDEKMPSVTYDGTITFAENKMTVGFIQQIHMLSQDETTKEYNLNTTLYLPDGSAKNEQEKFSSDHIKSREEMKEILEKCKEGGGERAVISVVGGDFDTCAVDDGKGNKVWLGDVPFNVVKSVSTDENKNVITLEISLSSFGK